MSSALGAGLNRLTRHFILQGKDGVWRWIGDFVGGLRRPRGYKFALAARVRLTPLADVAERSFDCPPSADTVEKVISGWRTKFFSAASG
jgi:hypothetical protein